VVKPQAGSPLTCEIQVRTLFEEAWGEIDHALNYPRATEILACKEQLRVLAKLASTGTRLADSIFATATQEEGRGAIEHEHTKKRTRAVKARSGRRS